MNSSSKISPINTKTFALKSEFYSTDSQVQIVNISDKLLPLPTPWTRLSPPPRRRSSRPRPHRSCSLIRTKVNKVNDNFTYDPIMYLCEFYFSSMRIHLWRFLHLWLLSVLYRSVGHIFPQILFLIKVNKSY